MKILVFGHSYVRDLASLRVDSLNWQSQTLRIEYKSFPGAGYERFLDSPALLESLLTSKPDIIIVILGGNSITRDIVNHELQARCKRFYQLLRQSAPNAILIPAQVELRRYSPNRRFDNPPAEIFKQKRNSLNQFLKRLRLKDRLLIIAGPGRLDDNRYYRDGVHLNTAGLRVYMNILKSTVVYALDHNLRVSKS